MGKSRKVQIKDKIKEMAIKQGMKIVLEAIKHIIISIISALLPYIGTILLAVTLITGFAYILEIFTAEDTSAAVRTAIGTENIADSIEIKSFDGGGYYISMPQDISKRLEKALKKAKVEYADLGIKNTSTIEKFIKAEIVTQYPDLGADLGQDNSSEKLQGAIKIKRATVDKSVGELKESDKKEEMLTYVDKTTFDEYIANNNIEAIKHFTLDESGNLIIASWSYTKKTKTENENIVEENTEYTIKQNSPINYKAQVEKYTMPFEYPLAFLIDGQDVEFAEKLADLALNSEIVITVQDNITTTENIISEKTTVTTEEKNVYSYKKADGSEEYNTETERKKIAEDITTIETKTITESNTPNIEITSVDSWCTKFTKKYSYITSDTGLTSGEPENADPTTVTKFNSIDINGNYINNITDNNGNHMQNTENNTSIEDNEKELENGDKLQRKENIQYITTAKSTTTSNRVITNKYNSGLSKTEGNEQKFVDAFRSSKQAKGNIMNEPEWLFDILENSDKTANMLDLTKYLLYKATGKDYGVTEFEFSIFDAGSFSGILGIGGAGFDSTITLEKFITLINAYTPPGGNGPETGRAYADGYNEFADKAESFYNICKESNVNQMLVFSIAVHESGYGTSKIYVDKKNPFGYGAYDGSAYSSAVTFKSLEDAIRAEAKLLQTYMTPGTWQYSQIQSNGYDPTTIDGIGSLYCTDGSWPKKVRNYMKTMFNYEESNFAGGEFLEIAKKCHDYLAQNQYFYSSSKNIEAGTYVDDESSEGRNIPVNIGESIRYIDCSAYVTWVLYEFGYTELQGWQKTSYWFMDNPYNWPEIDVKQAQPGDILVRSNHVEIYAGNGRSYSCGSTEHIRAETKAANLSGFTKALRPTEKK